MKLWLLKARHKELPNDDNPWDDKWDKNYSLVIRAETEEQARQLAQDKAGEESNGHETDEISKPWLYAKYTTCQELTADGNVEVICINHVNG